MTDPWGPPELPELKEPIPNAYRARFDPIYPCLRMLTRHCPRVLHSTCPEQGIPCARFSNRYTDKQIEQLWGPEL